MSVVVIPGARLRGRADVSCGRAELRADELRAELRGAPAPRDPVGVARHELRAKLPDEEPHRREEGADEAEAAHVVVGGERERPHAEGGRGGERGADAALERRRRLAGGRLRRDELEGLELVERRLEHVVEEPEHLLERQRQRVAHRALRRVELPQPEAGAVRVPHVRLRDADGDDEGDERVRRALLQRRRRLQRRAQREEDERRRGQDEVEVAVHKPVVRRLEVGHAGHE